MSTEAVPPAAAAANAQTLSDAMAAASLSETPEEGSNPTAAEEDLEDGEIREEEGDRDGVKTVFDDAKEFNVKHPLYAEWTLHFDSPQSKLLPKTPSAPGTPVSHGGWMDDIRKVVTFDSVEEFWGLYNNIIPPSQLPGKANYYLFKSGIMPAWEDAANKNGGKWSIQVPREKSKNTIDKMWLYTMLAAIGETFETPVGGTDAEKAAPTPASSDLVTGVIVSTRPGFYRINIWTRDAPDINAPETDPVMSRIMIIGRHFKSSVLGYDLDQKLVTGGFQTEVLFESHKDSEKKGNKNKIVL